MKAIVEIKNAPPVPQPPKTVVVSIEMTEEEASEFYAFCGNICGGSVPRKILSAFYSAFQESKVIRAISFYENDYTKSCRVIYPVKMND